MRGYVIMNVRLSKHAKKINVATFLASKSNNINNKHL